MENTLIINELPDHIAPAVSEQRQQGAGHLHHHGPSEAITVTSGVREPESDFLQGDAYPGRNHFERR